MCNSCVIPFHGKYLQQCEICGDPAHEPGCCVVGQPFCYPSIGRKHPKQRNCPCPQVYDSWGMQAVDGRVLE